MADNVAPLTVTKPLLSAGAFQFSTTALDNDLGTAPAGFWSVQPVDLLANDNAVASILNPASVLLYSAASGGSGARTLSTAQGLYSVDARGVLTLQPTADFSGSDSLWYTVADSTGRVSARTLVTVSATATSAARDDAATTLKTAADGVVAVSHYGVSDVTVSEGAGTAVFTVTGFEGSRINAITLADGSAVAGLDTGLGIEVFDGTGWVAYKTWDHLVPTDGDTQNFEPTSLQVRIRVTDDGAVESSETSPTTTPPASPCRATATPLPTRR